MGRYPRRTISVTIVGATDGDPNPDGGPTSGRGGPCPTQHCTLRARGHSTFRLRALEQPCPGGPRTSERVISPNRE